MGVPKFNGSQEALVRKKVMAVLKAHGYELVRSRDMQAAVASSGGSLDSDDGLKAVAKELALVAIVTGDVGAKRAKLVVHDGSEGSVLGDATFSGANPHKVAADVGATFWRKLGADIGRGHTPSGAKKNQKASEPEAGEEEAAPAAGEPAGGGAAEAAPAAAEEGAAAAAPAPGKKGKIKMEGEAAASEEPSTPSTPSGLAWLDLSIGGGGLNRSLTFHQDYDAPGNQLQTYSLPFGPVGIARAVIYPFDPLVGGILGNWGFEARAMIGFISSNLSSGASFSNTVHDFSGGTRFRFPFGSGNDVYISGRYGEDAFTFNASSATERGTLRTPDTIYHYIRPGIGLQLALPDALSLELNAGYRYVVNKGGSQISTAFFPHLAVQGADAEADLGYAFNEMYGLRLGVQWTRYWYAFNVKPGDTFLVGGAVDQSFQFTVALVFSLGSAPPAVAAEPEAAPAPAPAKKSKASKGENEGGGGSDEAGGGGDADTTSGGGAE